MAGTKRRASAASRVFIAFIGAVVVITALLVTLLAFQAQATERAEAEAVTLAVARTIAEMPEVSAAVTQGSDAAATAALQPIAVRIMDETPIDFVTIVTPDGIRLTHADPDEIGKPYLGTIGPGLEGRELTEEAVGTLGPSLRSVVPVTSDGNVVALVSAGITLGSVGVGVLRQVPFVVAIAIALAAIGLAAAWFAGRLTRRIAGDLPASAVRDAVSSYESVRTLGEALRAQTHEHGNRMHTAVALIELGRGDEAVELLTETARSSQALVDQVVARDGDPTVAALLLGKSSQAKERGVEWRTDMQPGIPRTTLSPVDAVSLVGNLIDNGIDAAAAGPEPRWMEVGMAQSAAGDIVLTFRDSGAGVPPALRERVFQHGFSTKPAGAEGRGVGLALVRSIVDAVGGSVELEDSPTTLRVTLPREGIRMIGLLIVDDERLTRELHAQYVERIEGFQVVGECSGARAAVTAVLERGDVIDLVLLDMTMPDGSGLDVARFIRSRAADVDIMAITAVRDAENVKAAAALGIAQYLVKPFTFATFRERLERYRDYRQRAADSAGEATQAEIDALLGALRPAASTSLPKGLAPATLDRVAAVARSAGAISAAEAAESLGMSRVAARRYLEHLADEKRVERSARYGTPGRPETEYIWR